MLEPPAATALAEVAFVAMPQPRFTVELPHSVMPVALPCSSDSAQNSPFATSDAVASAGMVTGPFRKKPEKGRFTSVERTTRTARLLPACGPAVGAFSTMGAFVSVTWALRERSLATTEATSCPWASP